MLIEEVGVAGRAEPPRVLTRLMHNLQLPLTLDYAFRRQQADPSADRLFREANVDSYTVETLGCLDAALAGLLRGT